MKIKEKIQNDIKDSMKANDIVKRETLRLLSGMIKNAEIEKGRESGEIGDEEVLKIIARFVKQRKESARQYREGGRNDLAEKEEQELKIVSGYLPEQLGSEEIKNIVKEIVAETKSESEADMGKVMGLAMKKMGGKADGNTVRQIVMDFLKSKK